MEWKDVETSVGSAISGIAGTLAIVRFLQRRKRREEPQPIRNSERSAILAAIAGLKQYHVQHAEALARQDARLSDIEDRVGRLEMRRPTSGD